MDIKKVNINGIFIDAINYSELNGIIDDALTKNIQTVIGYANANTINISYSDKDLAEYYRDIDFVHPDGIGIHYALKKLGGVINSVRFTGSDYYPLLADYLSAKRTKIFFLGHTDEILSRVKENNNTLNICGLRNGYNFTGNEADEINKTGSEILIAGLGTPLQEKWVSQNRHMLKCKVILLVGDGIKVFAGIKQRGPLFLRKLGFEWLYRLFTNPLIYFKRYIIGNPLFLYRIFRLKMRKLS